MANLKKLQASFAQKQADLDMLDDQIMGMPEMAMDAPADFNASPEFDLLTEKREELEEEVRKLREGVQLITEWEKFKGGQWSEDVKGLLGEIDIEISDIAGGDVASGSALPGGMEPPMGGMEPPMGDMGAAPIALPLDVPPTPAAPAPVPPTEPAAPAADATESAPIEPALASKGAGKSQVSEKTSYQHPLKKGTSARSDMNKEGSNMANPTPAKTSVQEKLAEVKTKREAIKREALSRVAAAWTIAKTMLPSAPAEIQKAAAANLLQNPTRVLNAMLRSTAKNAHYSKLAETFKQVHKVELNDLLEDPSVLNAEKKAVESEIKGDPKNAASKIADDRKDAGPQTETYNDGRGCGGGKHSEPKEMDAGSASSQTEAEHRPENTINKSEGDGKVAAKAAAAEPKTACGADCKGCDKCEKKASESKHAGHKPDCDCNFCEKKAAAKCDKCEGDCKCASAKTADDMPPMDAPVGDVPPMDAPVEEAPMDAAPEMPMEEPISEEGGDNEGEILSDEKKMVVKEKIETAEEAIKSLEQEILQEGEEELDFAQVFNEDEMEEKVSALANESDEHTAGNGEEFFAPSAAESMEASLDEPQMASMEDFFSLRGSDSDPLAHLIAGEIRTAADVAGMEVIPSSTGELANKMESNSTDADSRDNESDHEGDLFAEAIEDQKPEDGGFKRVKQDETNELEAPKAAAAKTAKVAPKKTPVISKLKGVTASEAKPIDIASALFGQDDSF